MIRTYNIKKYLCRDLIAGLSVGMIHIPQGMGFALLASVSPVYGLYSSFYPVVIYFIFGSSRHVSVGTMAIISLVIGSVVEAEARRFVSERVGLNGTMDANTSLWSEVSVNSSSPDLALLDQELQVYKASIAAALSLVAGGIMLAMGILRLGIITTLMPTSFVGGFTTGAAFHITTSQIKAMFGIQVNSYEGILKLPYTWIDICRNLPTTNIPTMIVVILAAVVLIFFKEFINEKFKKKLPVPIPIEMLVLVVATLCSHFLRFNGTWNIQTVGSIPRGLPAPFIPPIEKAPGFMKDAVVAALLSFAISISMADILSRKHKYQVNTNQELIANGLAYGCSSFFYCFIGAAAPPRCFVLDSTGGKTQMSSVFTALLLLLVLLAIGPLFESLPNGVLACIIVVALFPLFKQFQVLPSLWRLSKADFSIWVVTWLSSIVLSLDLSLLVGIGWSILTIALTAMVGKGYTLGRGKHQDLYAPTEQHKMAVMPEGVVVYRYESSLFFATINNFKRQLYKATVDPQQITNVTKDDQDKGVKVGNGSNEGGNGLGLPEVIIVEESVMGNQNSHRSQSDVNTKKLCAIILDCSPFAHVDLMGINVLKQLHSDYEIVNIKFILVNCTNNLVRKLEADEQIGGEKGDKIIVYPTIQDAVAAITEGQPECDNIVTYF